ncbi:MAG: prepilin-type N-terminal cleavage/methylation domain-containing protein [Pseudomonadota bacterium]
MRTPRTRFIVGRSHLRARAAQSGFTLIEVIGVLSIMAILASVIAPSVFDDIKRARQDKESLSLEGLAGYLQNFIVDNKRIPTRTIADWTAAIASQATLPAAKIEFNERGFRRGYYVDPRFFSTTDTNFPGYTQTTGLSNQPVSPRIMLISSLTANVPAAPTTAAAFDAIWEQAAGASLVEGPDIKIERLNLRNLFHRVILTNEHTTQPAYQLEAGAQSSLPAASGGIDGLITRYVMDKTRLNLMSDPFPSGTLNQVVLISSPLNYTYRNTGSSWEWQKP